MKVDVILVFLGTWRKTAEYMRKEVLKNTLKKVLEEDEAEDDEEDSEESHGRGRTNGRGNGNRRRRGRNVATSALRPKNLWAPSTMLTLSLALKQRLFR